ncbi:hypothetical protein N7470_002307 [Penicillium chermesinum]|nr:hypothetical protein N7470_002307 [Penicillium chermesinum]
MSTSKGLPSTPTIQSIDPDMDTIRSLFWVGNVHCASCVDYVTEVLSEFPSVKEVDVSVLTHEVRVIHGASAQPSDLVNALIHAAFEVHHATTYDGRGEVIADINTTSWNSRSSVLFGTPRNSYSSLSSNIKERWHTSREKRHISNCDACRKEQSNHHRASRGSEKTLISEPGTPSFAAETWASPTLPHSPKTLPGIPETPQAPSEALDEFSARVSIGGMSCAACVNSVTAAIREIECVKEATVNLLTNSATLTYSGPRANIDVITEHIEDIGFEAFIDEVNPVPKAVSSRQEPAAFITEIAITGMTCGSCVGTVTRGLEELPFVQNVSVNLLSHSGKVEFEGRENLDKIIEKIEDMGFDASVSSVHPSDASARQAGPAQARIVSIHIDGMFCHHCPQKVLSSLASLPGVEVVDEPSEKKPLLKLTYTPDAPSITIRSIISTINNADDAFNATIHHPPSIEDRSRAMQLHERSRLLCRLLFVFAVAIPTFIVGIVFMSLVSPQNPVRRFLEQNMWSGSVSRTEWALFIMSTPVMFYGTDVFHTRALKEIYALWRPGSRTPLLRRFYRFGSMNMLISAGTSVAYFASLAVLIVDAVAGNKSSASSTTYFDSVVFLTLFILAGRFLEAYSKAKTGDAVSSLGNLRPSEALLVEGHALGGDSSGDASDRTSRVSVDLLEVGDIVRIPHGASPPADGIVVGEGAYQFDESSLTGESRPVKKAAGDCVYTGSVNTGQPIQVRITELGGSSMLDRIIAVVREGQSKRAPVERVADLLTSHFVPVITLIAISTFIIWLALGHSGALPADYLDNARGGWTFWSLEFAIAVFVVACPCGLALAAPTALFVGGGLAAKHGILVKGGGEAFQEASRLDAIVFDKTGTLTEGGSLKVSNHAVLTTDENLLKMAWAMTQRLEESSNHPIAQAIVAFCASKPQVSVLSSDIQEIGGQGMKGTFVISDGETEHRYEAAIGNERLFHSLSPSEAHSREVGKHLSGYQIAGKSTAILSLRCIDPEALEKSSFAPALVLATSDTIRPETISVISELQNRKVEVFMCTGDNPTTAHAVADMVGIPRTNVMANALPAEKATFLRKIQDGTAKGPHDQPATRPIVAFVGDGVNDSPALAAADVSIAMASGSDVAINSASFILLNSDLSTILQLVLLSRRVFNRVRLNFVWAVFYNMCLVPVAAGVFYPIVSGHHQKVVNGEVMTVNEHWRLNPVWAALAMALSSISVVSSSLALRIDMQSIKKAFWKRK